jgi:hypothetical protein
MKTRDSKWLTLVSVVLIGFTQGGSVIRPPAKPSDIAKEYIYHLFKGEFDAAAKLMSAQMFARMTAQMSPRWLESKELDNAKTTIKEALKDKGGMKTIETEIEVIVGEAAKVALITIFNNGQVDTGYFELVKESGGWKIASQGPWGKPPPITSPPLK